MRRKLPLLIIGLFMLQAAAQDWPGFHGLEHQGVAPWRTSTLNSSNKFTVKWNTAIPGLGFSSPVVDGDKIFLTTAYETNKGAALRLAMARANVAFALALLTLVGMFMISTLAHGWPLTWRYLAVARVWALVGILLLVLAIIMFGPKALNLEGSVHRSWKVAAVSAVLSACLMLLLAADKSVVRWLFASVSTLLSILAYWHIPRRELFLNFSNSDGVISTSIVILPAFLGWGMFLILSILRPRDLGYEPGGAKGSLPALGSRLALCYGPPTLLVAALFWGLLRRVLRDPNVHASLTPTMGWTYLGFVVVACLTAILLARILTLRGSNALAWLTMPSVILSSLLAFGCFVRFGCLPAQKQVAHAVVCLERTTGRIQWLREVAFSSNLRDLKEINSHATPTLAISADLMCAYFGTAGLYGLDHRGNVRWHVKGLDFQGDYGVGQSPTFADNVVVLVNDYEVPRERAAPKSQIAAYNLSDGQLLWRQERARSEPGSGGFTTPIIRTLGGTKTVLVRGWEDLTAYDLHTGKIRWTFPLKHRGDHLVASLVTDAKRLYVMDATRVFALELDALEAGRADLLWTVRLPGEKDSTPVVSDGLLFAATETGVMACIDVESGVLKWKEKFRGKFFASVVALGESVLFAAQSGNLLFTARSSEFALRSEIPLREKIYATPVPLADGILVRTTQHLHWMEPRE